MGWQRGTPASACGAAGGRREARLPRLAVRLVVVERHACLGSPVAACLSLDVVAAEPQEAFSVTVTGLAVFVILAFLLPVPVLAWLDRPSRGRRE